MAITHKFDESTNGESTNASQMPLDPWCEAGQFPGASEIKVTSH